MPTSYIDQFFVIDPGNAPASGTALAVTKFTYIDQDDNGQISPSGDDSAGGLDITNVWVGDTITVVVNGVTQTITGVTFYVTGGPAIFTPTDGTILSDATFVSSTWVDTSPQIPVGSFGPPCFTPGTRIAVPGGEVAIETLKPGDLVMTLDHGAQPVRWIGRRQVDGRGEFAPVRFAAGIVGNRRALLVSPQHRMLIGGWQAELYYGEGEVLVAAVQLAVRPGICRQPQTLVDYVHLMFDRHEIILAEGAPSESFHPGSCLLDHDLAALAEVVAIFPQLRSRETRQALALARPEARGRLARALAA